jgi:hypothetical protein
MENFDCCGIIAHQTANRYQTDPVLPALRNFNARWHNRKVDGGLELPPKSRPERLGHASNMMTSHIYGHLFSSADDGAGAGAGRIAADQLGRACSNGATWPAMSRYTLRYQLVRKPAVDP